MGRLRILVTGAAGFLGRATVNAAFAEGHDVIALVRRSAGTGHHISNATEIACDLAGSQAPGQLPGLLPECDAVIHTAASLTGDDAAHQRDTLAATENLLAAIATLPPAQRPRFILASSLSVYGFASLPDGVQLDELSPLEADPDRRDAYCRAKLAQEALVAAAVREHGVIARTLRIGAVYGPGRLWTARLGVLRKAVALGIGGDAALPLTHVSHAALALVKAAEKPLVRSDLSSAQAEGHLDIINVVEDDLPTQRMYLNAMRASGRVRSLVSVPRTPLLRLAKLIDLVGMCLPGLARRVPGLLRLPSLHARLKPLRYSSARLQDRLGHIPSPGFQRALAGRDPEARHG